MTFLPLRLREAWNLGGFTPRQLAVRTWTMVNEREIMTRAAGVAFYAMLAFVPLLGLILTVVVQLLPDPTLFVFGPHRWLLSPGIRSYRIRITAHRYPP